MAIDIIDAAIRVSLVIATSIIFAIVFAAYLRVRNRKLLFISIGFGVFFAHSPMPSSPYPNFMITENMHLAIHFIALAFILFGTLKD